MQDKKTEIIERLTAILSQKYGVGFECYDSRLMEAELMGNSFRIHPRDLVCLFFDIEKEFGIRIPEEAVAEGRFNNLKNIADIIECELRAS